MTVAVPINAIITTVCLRIFSHTETCYLDEIKTEVEKAAGKPLGEAFLISSVERQGYKYNAIAGTVSA